MKKLFLVIAVGALLAGCKKDDDHHHHDDVEAKYLNILVSDAEEAKMRMVNPMTKSVTAWELQAPNPSIYATGSGQFAAILHRTDNLVVFFNSGVEKHGNHLHVKTPEMATLQFSQPSPTHFKSWDGLSAIFNDGNGSLSVARDVEIKNGTQNVLQVADAHHGAMAIFDDYTIAVTVKDGSVSGSLPERVRIINRLGEQLYASTIATGGIHGNASNGKVAAFGSASGVLIVKKSGEQFLVEYPSSFGTNWFGTILGNPHLNHFFGFHRNLGLYMIDHSSKQVKEIIKNDGMVIQQYKLDPEGKKLFVLLSDGHLKVFDAITGQEQTSRKVVDSYDNGLPAVQKPKLEVSKRCVYISQYDKGEILMMNKNNLNLLETLTVGGKPANIVLLGDMDGLEDHEH